ncbi:MAG: hypothetical protein VX394_06595, partial [Pseudomonadota bacterium]|nr:hypothetical protein [Pseudomonadota bacterium]
VSRAHDKLAIADNTLKCGQCKLLVAGKMPAGSAARRYLGDCAARALLLSWLIGAPPAVRRWATV